MSLFHPLLKIKHLSQPHRRKSLFHRIYKVPRRPRRCHYFLSIRNTLQGRLCLPSRMNLVVNHHQVHLRLIFYAPHFIPFKMSWRMCRGIALANTGLNQGSHTLHFLHPLHLPCACCFPVLHVHLLSPISISSIFSANGSADQVMHVQLGQTQTKAISDGGLSVYPSKTLSCSYPILCIEVSPP